MNAATLNGLRTHFAVTGDPDGTPVVFANALGTDLRVWDALLPHLPEGLRVVRYDMRGHGLTDAPAGDYAMATLVADAAALVEHLALGPAVVVGLSIGGMVAQGLAAERPDLVRALVLSNSAARIGTPEVWHERMAAVRVGGIECLADAVMERWFSRAFHETRPDEVGLWRTMLVRTPAAGYLGCCAALARADLRATTGRLALPVLAIAGSEDGSTPPDVVRETADSIAGCRFEIVRGAGHIPCVEKPAVTGRAIGAFLQDHDLA